MTRLQNLPKQAGPRGTMKIDRSTAQQAYSGLGGWELMSYLQSVVEEQSLIVELSLGPKKPWDLIVTGKEECVAVHNDLFRRIDLQ